MSRKILFVEDDAAIALIYAKVLRQNGFETELAYDGQSGLDEAQKNHYDIILLDLMLPSLSGADVLKTLRDKNKSPSFSDQTKIIILTNFEVDDIMKQELLSMAEAYLVKVDITPRSLVTILNELEIAGQDSGGSKVDNNNTEKY